MLLDQFNLDGKEKVILGVALVMSFVMAMRRSPNDRPGDSPSMQGGLAFARTAGVLMAAILVIAIYRMFLK